MNLFTLSNILAVGTGIVWIFMGWWGKYDRWWWYDNLAHFLAGFTLGGLAADGGFPLVYIRALGFALLCAIVWEAYEYEGGITPWNSRWSLDRAWEDTILDTKFVLVGAALAASVAYVL